MLCKLTRLSKKKYYFNENFTNLRKTWEGIKSLLNRKKNKNNTINTLKNFGSNTTTNNKSIISNVLNKHFTSIGTKLAARLPNSEKHFTQFLYKNKSLSSSFLFQPKTPDEVKLEITAMPVNKSHGFYSFPAFILKYACDNIKDILAIC